jgi:hypothetical protein
MRADLSQPDRRRLQEMAACLRAYSRDWRRRVLDELARGPATREELLVDLSPTGGVLPTGSRAKALAALAELIAEGLIRERPELQPCGRAVRVAPVVVLELTAAGLAATGGRS